MAVHFRAFGDFGKSAAAGSNGRCTGIRPLKPTARRTVASSIESNKRRHAGERAYASAMAACRCGRQSRPDLACEPTADRTVLFRRSIRGSPPCTSLCMMAFIAHGHVPGKGQYGTRLERAADFVVSCQKPNGLVTKLARTARQSIGRCSHEIGSCAAYNHAISSLVLSEVYGMSPPSESSPA